MLITFNLVMTTPDQAWEDNAKWEVINSCRVHDTGDRFENWQEAFKKFKQNDSVMENFGKGWIAIVKA